MLSNLAGLSFARTTCSGKNVNRFAINEIKFSKQSLLGNYRDLTLITMNVLYPAKREDYFLPGGSPGKKLVELNVTTFNFVRVRLCGSVAIKI